MLQDEKLEYYYETKDAIDNLMRFKKYTDAFQIAESFYEIFADDDIIGEEEKIYISKVLVGAYLNRRSLLPEKSNHTAFQAALYLVKSKPDEENFLNLAKVSKIYCNSLRGRTPYTEHMEILLNEIIFAVFSRRAIKGYDTLDSLSMAFSANMALQRKFRRMKDKDAQIRQKIANLRFVTEYDMKKSRRTIARDSVEIAEYLASKQENESATTYYLMAIDVLSEICCDSDEILLEFEKICESTAKHYYVIGEYEKALELLDLLAELIKSGIEDGMDNDWLLALVYDFTDTVYRTMGRYDESKRWHEKAVETAQKYSEYDHVYHYIYLMVTHETKDS